VFPALVEFDAIHGGGAAYLLVSIALPELLATLGGEEHLADPAFWNTKRVYNTDSLVSAKMLQRLIGIISGIEHKFTAPSADRSYVDAILRQFRLAIWHSSTGFPRQAGLPPTIVPTLARRRRRPCALDQ
jgi:hypothetical protein